MRVTRVIKKSRNFEANVTYNYSYDVKTSSNKSNGLYFYHTIEINQFFASFWKIFGCTFPFQNIILLKNYWKCVFLQLEITRITRMELVAGKLPAINYPPRAGLRVIDHPNAD